MKQFYLLLFLTFALFADSTTSQFDYTETIYYPIEKKSYLRAERYFKDEILQKIEFGTYPQNSLNQIYGLKFYYNPDAAYSAKEFDSNKKLHFTHSFEKQNDGWLFKGYYPHVKNEKKFSSKILYQIIKFNSSGQILHKAYFNKYHKLTSNDSGIAKIKYVYDTKGNLIQQTTKDWKERVHPNEEGIGISNFAYDTENRLKSKIFFRKEGVPKKIENQISKVEYGYDNKCLSFNKYKNKNNPLFLNNLSHDRGILAVNCVNSVTYFKFSKDCMGYCAGEDRFGIHSYTFQYDESCLANQSKIYLTKEDQISSCMHTNKVINANGKSVNYPFSYSLFKSTDKDEIFEFFNEEGELKKSLVITKSYKSPNGVKAYKYQAFGSDNKPDLIDNISMAISKEDSKGNILLNEYYGLNGELTVDDIGISREIFSYDPNCLQINKNPKECIQLEEKFGENGKYLKDKNGIYPKILSTFNAKGKKLKTEYYRLNDNMEIVLFYIEKFEYDKDNNLITKRILNPDNKPFALENGVYSVHYKYDIGCIKLGQLNSEDCFSLKLNRGVNGKLTEFFVAKHFQKFKNGILYYSASYNNKGQLENNSNGYAKMEKSIDDKGRVLHVKYKYQKKDPYFIKIEEALNYDSNSRIGLETFSFNSFGNKTKRSYDLKNNLLERQVKDKNKKEIEWETFLPKNKFSSFDYSLYFPISENETFRLKLDSFRRPVDVEVIQNAK